MATNLKKPTVRMDSLVGKYLVCGDAEGKSHITLKGYAAILKSYCHYFCKEYSKPFRISDFTVDNARGYISYLKAKPKYLGHPFTPEREETLSPTTIQDHVRVLKALASWLYREGYTRENRLMYLKLPKAPTRVIEPLNPEEINRVLEGIDKESLTGRRNNAIVNTMLDTGIRASEAATLTMENSNVQNRYLKVFGKGAKERIVPIGRFVQTIMDEYLHFVRPKLNKGDSFNVFLSENGDPITVNTIKLFFARLSKKSGVERLHAHLCRHTFAINYLLNGGDIFSLKEILGHSSLEMVNRYLHFTNSQIRALHSEFSPMDHLRGAQNKGKE